MQRELSTKFNTDLCLKKKKKAAHKISKEGTYLNIIKSIYDKLMASTVLNGEKLKMFPLRSGTRVPSLLTIIQYSFGSHSNGNQRIKRKKRNPDWKRISKTLTICG